MNFSIAIIALLLSAMLLAGCTSTSRQTTQPTTDTNQAPAAVAPAPTQDHNLSTADDDFAAMDETGSTLQ